MSNKIIFSAVAAFLLVSGGCATTNVKKVTYIEINARGCYICQRMDPILTEIEKDYKGQVDINTYSGTSDGADDIVKKYNIRKFPANIFLDDKGAVFFRYEGLLDSHAIRALLKDKGIFAPGSATQGASAGVTGQAAVK